MTVGKNVTGAAARTSLSGAITAGAPIAGGTFTVADATGYPTANFVVDMFIPNSNGTRSNEEKIFCSSRSGNVITVGASGRGYDGTTAASHASGETVIHNLDAITVQALIDHVDNTAHDDHTQYLPADASVAGAGLTHTSRSLAVNVDNATLEIVADILREKDGGTSLAKLASLANATVIGRNTAGTGVPEAVTMAQLRTLLALVIGTNVQAWDADLDAIAALGSAADKVPYATGAQAWALATLTSFIRTLLDDPDAATARATLGLGTLATKSTIVTGDITDGTILPADADNTFFAATSAVVKTHMKSASGGQTAMTATSSPGTLIPMKSTHNLVVNRAGQAFVVIGIINPEYTGGTGGGDKQEGVVELFVDGALWTETEAAEAFTPQIIGKGNIASVLFRLNLPQVWAVTGLAVGSHPITMRGYKISSGDTFVIDDGHTGLTSMRFG